MKKTILSVFLFFGLFTVSAQSSASANNSTIYLRFNQHDSLRYNRSIIEKTYPLPNSEISSINFNGGIWEVNTLQEKKDENKNMLKISMTLKSGTGIQTVPSLLFEIKNWSEEGYLLLPGAAYNGNRFESRRIRYSPKLMDPRDYEKGMPAIVSDIPRLNNAQGLSQIQDRSGSLTSPVIGLYSPVSKSNTFISFTQKNEWGDYGLTIEENPDRSKIAVIISSPVLREYYKYRITDNQYPTDDKAPTFKVGDRVEFKIQVESMPSTSIVNLFEDFYALRKSFVDEKEVNYALPLSACFDAQEDKFNSKNYIEDFGYYAVGMRNGKYKFLQDWQIGWTGGMISTYPLLFAGGEDSKNNVISNFNFLFPNGICPAGFFWDAGESNGDEFTWIGGDPRKMNTANWHLIRKTGDAIYYITKQLELMKLKSIPIDPSWEEGLKSVCDRIVKLWVDNGDFGQFVDSQTGDIKVHGSTSGAIIPAGLVLASKYFNNDTYMKVAKESADYYYNNFILKGFTSGGPGDAMQNPDSESSYALLESFMVLYETSNEEKWKEYGVDMAHQFSSWVMTYDYEFPKNSTLGNLGIKTTGSVCANTQNKHGAPGICTHSGIALLRLFRATGDKSYLDLLHDITQHIPQNLSHPLKPIKGMEYGWMSERVSTTDWYEGIGELMYGSTWAETALMLTYIEIPGLYVQPDKSVYYAFDQVQVKKKSESKSKLVLEITNTTSADAEIKIFTELSANLSNGLENNYLYDSKILSIQAGQTITKSFKK